ncbi:hypothetical protein T05_332 [Trichinella murrelli]|uniref:Uncharacterized protein n=1 Tax=Trichinella murrelli TaxID=144512 RepID=A0A0V0TCZ1_9BILA|nr:hypothetical protein T05_332 [Trichinella murrelli]
MLICDDVAYSSRSGRRKLHSTFSLLRCCILSVMSPMNPVSQRQYVTSILIHQIVSFLEGFDLTLGILKLVEVADLG